MTALAMPAMSPALRPPDPDPEFEELDEEVGVVDGLSADGDEDVIAVGIRLAEFAVAVATSFGFAKVVEMITTELDRAAPAAAVVASGMFEVAVELKNIPTSI